MKDITYRRIQQSEQFLSRAFIDRKNKKDSAILAEQRSITKECKGNVLPAYLYNYYVSICQIPSWNLTNDAMVAKQLGVTERKVADTRRMLTKLGWIRFDTHKHNGIQYGMWYLGKEVVAAKIGLGTTLDEYYNLGVVTNEEYEAGKKYEETANEEKEKEGK